MHKISLMLKFRPELVNSKDYISNNPIVWAIKRGYLKMTKMLIQKGANPLDKNY